MKLGKILERMAAEVYNTSKMKIKYLSPDQQVINIDTSTQQMPQTMKQYPALRQHLSMILQYIKSLDKNTLKTYDIDRAGWDIDINPQARLITIRNDQGQVIKTFRL